MSKWDGNMKKMMVAVALTMVFSLFFTYAYLEYSKADKRKECADMVSQLELIAREQSKQARQETPVSQYLYSEKMDAELRSLGFDLSPSKLTEEEVKKFHSARELLLKKAHFRLESVPSDNWGVKRMNNEYRMCLAQRGIEPESLFEIYLGDD